MTTTIKAIIFTILLYSSSSFLFGQKLEDDYNIKSYAFSKGSEDDMPYLDSIVEDYNHFFMDEYHSKSMDDNLKKKFVRYFAENKKLDKIVMEEPYAYGYWVNRYLQSGDTILLKTFLDNYYTLGRYGKNRPEQIPDYYDFFKFVYDLNNKNKLEIEVAGIDVNAAILKPDFWTLKRFFEEYKLEEDFPKAYKSIVKLESKKKVKRRNAKRWLKKFKHNRTAKEDILESKLKDELVHFNNVILNLSNSLKMHSLRSYFFHPTGYRDSLMHIQYPPLARVAKQNACCMLFITPLF
jgi:hypothetical protein